MGKHINKALLYKEWKTAKWLVVGVLIEFLFLWVFKFNETVYQCRRVFIGKITISGRNGVALPKEEMIQSEVLKFFNNSSMNTLIIIIISVVIVASIIIGIDRFNKNFNGICHMPFRRDEIIITKWITGILTVELPIIIAFLAVLLMYYQNIDMLKGVINTQVIIKWFVLNSLVYGFVITFTMLIQCFTSLSALGAIFSLGLLFLPSVSIWFFIISILGINDGRYGDILNWIIPPITLAAYNFEFQLGGTVYVLPVYIRISILVLSIVACFQFMKYCFNQNYLEKVSAVIVFDRLNLPFKISSTLGFGIVGTLLIVFTLGIEPSLIWVSIFIIWAIGIYYLADRIVKRNF